MNLQTWDEQTKRRTAPPASPPPKLVQTPTIDLETTNELLNRIATATERSARRLASISRIVGVLFILLMLRELLLLLATLGR